MKRKVITRRPDRFPNLLLGGLLWCVLFVGANSLGLANDWTQFRGGSQQGKIQREDPVRSLADNHLVWSKEIPSGHSSPVVSQGKIYLTSSSQDDQIVTTHCFSLKNGEMLWQATESVEKWASIHSFNSQATPTCCCDEEGVVSYFGSYGLIRYSHVGEKIWEIKMPISKVQYGVSTSPVVLKNRVFLVRDSREGSSLSCYSLVDGQQIWTTERPLNSTNNSTPLIIPNQNGTDLIAVNGTPVSHVYDCRTGEPVFWNAGYPFEAISVPLWIGDKVIFSNRGTGSPGDPLFIPSFNELMKRFADADQNGIATDRIPSSEMMVLRPEVEIGGSGRKLALVRLVKGFMDQDKDGLVTLEEYNEMKDKLSSNRNKMASVGLEQKMQVEDSELDWIGTKGVPEMANPIEIDGKIFTIEDGGIYNLIDFKSGNHLIKGRISTRGRYTASPVCWHGLVYLISNAGNWSTLTISGSKIKTEEKGALGERVFATPAPTKKGLVVRTENSLRLYRD